MSDHSGQTSEMGRADGPTMIWTRWRGEALASVDRYGPRRNSTVTSVRLVAGEADFGRFSLQANQASPLSAFVPLGVLQEQVKHPGKANLLLTSAGTNVNAALRADWE